VSHTLLLVDDSVTIQRVIELTFAEEDVHVAAVSSGEQAIARLKESPPDIVLADVGMPGANGYEVARFIRQDPLLQSIPVVLLSGAFEPVDHQKAQEVGCDGILAKPFEPQLVIAKVRELLGRTPSVNNGTVPSGSARPDPASSEHPRETTVVPDAHSAGAASLDDYFDRLDAAFATLTAAGASGGARPATSGPKPVAPLHDAPVSNQGESGLPPLAEAFAALLAAEDGGSSAKGPAVWPAGGTRAAGGVSDATIDEIVDRVLARLSDRLGTRNIGRIVEDVAERVVREEIERLKASIP